MFDFDRDERTRCGLYHEINLSPAGCAVVAEASVPWQCANDVLNDEPFPAASDYGMPQQLVE